MVVFKAAFSPSPVVKQLKMKKRQTFKRKKVTTSKKGITKVTKRKHTKKSRSASAKTKDTKVQKLIRLAKLRKKQSSKKVNKKKR
jgi:hypothetical protein